MLRIGVLILCNGKRWQMIWCHLQTLEMWVLAWIMDTSLVPLMRLGVRGGPSLGIGS